MTSSTSPYTRATQFLAAVQETDRVKILDELEKMQDCVSELDPANPNSETLSAHRQEALSGQITDLFQRIEAKLRPVVLSPHQAAQQQIQILRDLSQRRASMTPKAFHAELKMLHPNVLNKLYEAVWIASGAPKQPVFASGLIKVDSSILAKNFSSLLGIRGGTIFEQVEAEVLFDFELNTAIAAKQDTTVQQMIKPKVQFFRQQFADKGISRNQIKAIYKSMPTVIQEQLGAAGYKFPFYSRDLSPDLYKTLGAHYNSGSGRTTFRVYAPNAREIRLNLTAFGHVQHSIPMRKGSDGVWSVETEHAKPGRSYHLMVTGKDGGVPIKKVDPFAFQNLIHSRKPLEGVAGREQIADVHESIVYDVDKEYRWSDSSWMATRHTRHPAKDPMTIYEVHPSTWQVKPDGRNLNWRELAPALAQYCKEMGYNTIELMAMFAHPQQISMGYQITNFFAPDSQMGTWEDFQYFVDFMHNVDLGNGRKGISIIADWVPAHFALDEFALGQFDGTSLFEDDIPDYAEHPTWGTKIFDFKKRFTQDFMTSSADFLLKKMHIDGLRVDAVASMLYMNYDRDGEKARQQFFEKFGHDYAKRFNTKGTEVDLAARGYLRSLNSFIHENYPGVITIAEESSNFPNVTRPTYQKGEHDGIRGIGFDLAWHMGWMNDSLTFWKMPSQERLSSFGLFTHTVQGIDMNSDIHPRGTVVLAYSHDESANAKGTILTKMSGFTRADKFANGRLALAYQLLRGGGPSLDFMGNELLQSDEWHGRLITNLKNPTEKPKSTVQWEELDPSVNPWEHHLHRGAQASRRDLNRLFLDSPGLWDQKDSGFAWIDNDDTSGVLSFHRRGSGQQFACVFNSSDQDFAEYLVTLPNASYAPELVGLTNVRVVYNTDDVNYGGQGRPLGNVEIVRDLSSGRPTHLKLRLPPYTSIVLEEQFA